MMMEFGIPEDDHDYYDSHDCMEMAAPYIEGLEACTYTEDNYGDNCWVILSLDSAILEDDCY
jgi:hypothetical protein